MEKLLPLIQTSAGEEKRALSAEVKAYLQRAEELAAIDEKKLPSLRHPSSPASSVQSSSGVVSTFRAAAEESEFPLQQYPLCADANVKMCYTIVSLKIRRPNFVHQ